MKQLYSQETIQERVKDLAKQINNDFVGEELVNVIVTMNGAFVFAADLIRQLNVPLTLHFTGGSYFEGAIKHDIAMDTKTMPASFANAPVLIVEDVLDSGKSLKQLRQLIADKHAGSIKVATLLKRQTGNAKADYVGFNLPRELFVVGYGLDMDGRHRELKDILTFENTLMSGSSGNC